jgi:hypothetical protein
MLTATHLRSGQRRQMTTQAQFLVGNCHVSRLGETGKLVGQVDLVPVKSAFIHVRLGAGPA